MILDSICAVRCHPYAVKVIRYRYLAAPSRHLRQDATEGENIRRAMSARVSNHFWGTVCSRVSVGYPFGGTIATIIEYVAGSEISEVDLLTLHLDISWFDVFVADVPRVNVSQSVSKTCHPLPNQTLFLSSGAGFIGQVRLQVTVG